MQDEGAKRLAELVESVQASMQSIERAQRRRAALTAAASAGADGRVTVTVNADGHVIETRFAPDVEMLPYDEIATAVTAAAQAAVAEVNRRTAELMEPLMAEQSQLPMLAEFVAGIPDVVDMFPALPQVSMAPPGSPHRLAAIQAAAAADNEAEFGEVQPWDHGKPAGSGSEVTESQW